MVDKFKNLTRGERNNNPGNIRSVPGISWLGQIAGKDQSFATFDSSENGIRALVKLLRNYQRVHGLKTVRQIIARYAPPADNNNTSAYSRAVASALGVGEDAEIDLSNNATMTAMVAAIIRHENGRNIYQMSQIGAVVQGVA